LKVCIHRGAHEIGGSCVELRADGKSILLDLGMPLDADSSDAVPLPPVAGLTEADDNLLGIVLSHPHQDHWGLVPRAVPQVPIYLGEAAHRILREAAFFGAGEFDRQVAGYLVDRQPFDIGPFRITPYLVDHSAFDSYALLIEADGKRLFYTGDFRAHGRKGSLFERLVREPPVNVDALLTEGTVIAPAGDHRVIGATENEVEQQLVGIFGDAPGPVFVAMSAQNIDRLVSVYRACKRTERVLVVDLYAATIAAATGRSSIPQPGFPNYRVWVPFWQRVQVKRAEEFERVNSLGRARIYPKELRDIASRAVFLFRASMAKELEDANCLADARLVWSLWAGYLRPPHDDAIRPFLGRHKLKPIHCHSSGHAGIDDIKRLVAAIRPGRVVPMHTFGPERFEEVLDGVAAVEVHDDGDWWEV
jgi:ribonuclease J